VAERERRRAERHRVDAEQEVMHDRVADDRDLEDLRDVDAALDARPASRLAIASRTARVIAAAPPSCIIA
jgi:hypothetical protein